jgi:hypothetical protein
MHCTKAIPSAWSCSRWGLPSQPVARLLVSAYLTISPLPGTLAWRYVSVALSLRSLSLAVNQHPALWSSDFPRTIISMIRDCLSSSNPLQKSSISCPLRPVQKPELFLRLLNRASILWGESGMQGLAPLTEREVSSHASLSQNPLEMETFSIMSIAN